MPPIPLKLLAGLKTHVSLFISFAQSDDGNEFFGIINVIKNTVVSNADAILRKTVEYIQWRLDLDHPARSRILAKTQNGVHDLLPGR